LADRHFSFNIDDNIEKIVTVKQSGRVFDVSIRFAEDTLVEERGDQFISNGAVEMISDDYGLTLSYSRPSLFGLPARKAVRRY
jgi:hypothetical protein